MPLGSSAGSSASGWPVGTEREKRITQVAHSTSCPIDWNSVTWLPDCWGSWEKPSSCAPIRKGKDVLVNTRQSLHLGACQALSTCSGSQRTGIALIFCFDFVDKHM